MKLLLISLGVVAALSIDNTIGTLVFMVAILAAVVLGIRDSVRSPQTIRRVPTAHERGSRWVPGVGIGVGTSLRPFAFLTARRWRR